MAQNTRRDPRAKVLSMTVRYRSATLGEFIEHHSYDVSRGGMFIKTPSPFPAGTLLKFEVKIAEEQRVMQGVGRVVWKRDSPVADTDEPAGMGIKFIKIDEGSRAVIERLLESRGGGTSGAFDRSPDQPASGMFPGSENLELPPPEDRTVMKPASELLAEAIRKTAEETAPVSTRQATVAASGGFETVRATPQSFGPPPFEADDGESEPPRPSAVRIPSLESLDRTQRSPLELGAESPAKPRQASIPARLLEPDEEGGGGRALFLFVAVAAVAVGIWVLTKRGGQNEPAPEPSAEMAPAQSAAPNAKPIEQPLPAEIDVPETPPAASALPGGSAAPEASSAPAVSAAPAQPVVTAVPALVPVPKPKPVVKKPKVAPTTEPTTATPPAAPTPTTAPTSTPKPTPGPTPAPPVKSEVENPY